MPPSPNERRLPTFVDLSTGNTPKRCSAGPRSFSSPGLRNASGKHRGNLAFLYRVGSSSSSSSAVVTYRDGQGVVFAAASWVCDHPRNCGCAPYIFARSSWFPNPAQS